jgi:hypothetical protein
MAKPPATTPNFDARRLRTRLEFLGRNNISKSEFDRRKKVIEAEMRRTGCDYDELPQHIKNLLPKLTWTSAHRYGISYGDEAAWQDAPKAVMPPAAKPRHARASA